jgi:hypothetical protein
VRVAIKGHGHAGVPEKVLDQLRVDAAPQKQGGARVPEIVPANRGEASAPEERLEVAVDYVLDVQGGAYLCGENEAKEKESISLGVRLFTITPYVGLS